MNRWWLDPNGLPFIIAQIMDWTHPKPSKARTHVLWQSDAVTQEYYYWNLQFNDEGFLTQFNVDFDFRTGTVGYMTSWECK